MLSQRTIIGLVVVGIVCLVGILGYVVSVRKGQTDGTNIRAGTTSTTPPPPPPPPGGTTPSPPPIVSSSVGVTGPTGPAGPTGPMGLNGLDGTTGPMGLRGYPGLETGAPGLRGEPGPMGPMGIPGLNGMDGVTGPMGDPGVTGPTGETGPRGNPGVDGPSGEMGPMGDSGITGATGPTGNEGPRGLTGTPGVIGAQGAQGALGARGLTGPTGVGPTGNGGPPGLMGLTGPRGSAGSVGSRIPGVTGPTGPTGNGGPEGVKGMIGNTGDTGPMGPTGSLSITNTYNARYVSVKRIANSLESNDVPSTLQATRGTIRVMDCGTKVLSTQTNQIMYAGRGDGIVSLGTASAHNLKVGDCIQTDIPSTPSLSTPANLTVQVLSVPSQWSLTYALPAEKQTINLATFAVWADINGFPARVYPTRVFATPRLSDQPAWDKSNAALDDNPDTVYHSQPIPPRPITQYITLDLGTTRKVSRVLLISRPGNDQRMTGLQLQLGDGTQNIVYARNLTTAQSAYDITFGGASDPPVVPLMTSEYPEVFYVYTNFSYAYTSRDQARAKCAEYGAELATYEELLAAQKAGAQWCATGWMANNTPVWDAAGNTYGIAYPMQEAIQGCGTGAGIMPYTPIDAGAPNGRGGANCYGVKPLVPKPNDQILQWSSQTGKVSYYDPRRPA